MSRRLRNAGARQARKNDAWERLHARQQAVLTADGPMTRSCLNVLRWNLRRTKEICHA